MRKIIFTNILTWLFIFTAYSQTYIEPFLGYRANQSTKLNDNPAVTLKQIYTGIQLSKLKRDTYEYAFQLSIGIPIAEKGSDSSFTLNTNLPLYASANKTIKVFSIFSYFIQKYKLIGFKNNDKINVLVNTGLAYRSIKVSYNTDKNNYVILNPDKTQNVFGASLGFGFQYTHSFKKNRFFIQADIDFPLIRQKNKYFTSFKTLVPLTVIAGYSFEIKNKKHGK
jgi:hypothetical protein